MEINDRKELIKAICAIGAIVLLALLGQIVTGCCPRMYPPSKIEHVTDTVIRERLIHDTMTFEVPKEVEKVVTRDTISHLENEWAESDAVVDGGFLHHSLMTKPHTVYIPVTTEVHDTTVVVKDSETIVKEVNKLTRWQRLQMSLFWMLAAIVAWFVTIRIVLGWKYNRL